MFSKLIQIFIVLALGALFACLFSVPVKKIRYFYGKHISWLRRHKKVRNIISVLSWYVFIFVFLLVMFLLLYYNLYQYFSKVPWNEFMEKVNKFTNMLIINFPFLKNIGFEKYIPELLDSLMKLPGILAKIVVAIMISIYLLLDWDFYISGFHRWKKECLRGKLCRLTTIVISETKEILFGYMKGQSLDGLTMGILLGFGLWFLKVPLGISIGILAGIGNLIPYVGPMIAFSFTVFFCLIEGKTRTLIWALLYLIIIQQVDSSFIGPKLLGKQMHIRPLFVIVSILVGGTLFGPIGMIFAVPVAAILKAVVKLLRKEYCS